MKYITAKKFMSQYQITKQTLYQWRKTGKVNFIKQGKQSYITQISNPITKLLGIQLVTHEFPIQNKQMI